MNKENQNTNVSKEISISSGNPDSKFKIFYNEDREQLKTLEKSMLNPYMGFFYVLEYGEFLKIGSSKKPYSRLKQLQRQAEKYGCSSIGRMAVSLPHTNYRDNEKEVHRFFQQFRIDDTELFNYNFEKLMNEIDDLYIEYLDETAEFERKAELFCANMKGLLLKKYNLE